MRSEVPVRVAAFIGRERERAAVADLVATGRVVTLTGPGGCGKTRLAGEVVGDVASRFSDGARWVDLQGVSEPAMVARAVAAVVGVHEGPGQALVDRLSEQLHARHLLVVLDNCEHLVEACAELVGELSSGCPRLHLLGTGRVPLVVEGEATFDVAPLPVPDPDASPAASPATCRACGAVASAVITPTSASAGWLTTSSPTSTASARRPGWPVGPSVPAWHSSWQHSPTR